MKQRLINNEYPNYIVNKQIKFHLNNKFFCLIFLEEELFFYTIYIFGLDVCHYLCFYYNVSAVVPPAFLKCISTLVIYREF